MKAAAKKRDAWKSSPWWFFCPSREQRVHWKMCAHHSQNPEKDCFGCVLWWGKKEAKSA